MWLETELSYLAGIIDGEGTIFIQKKLDKRVETESWTYWPRVQVCNTNEAVMQWIHQIFGGLLYKKERSHLKRNWKCQFEWYTKPSLIDELLPLLIPYLIIKKPQAEIMMKFRKSFSSKIRIKVTPEIQSFREECMSKLKHLNNS